MCIYIFFFSIVFRLSFTFHLLLKLWYAVLSLQTIKCWNLSINDSCVLFCNALHFTNNKINLLWFLACWVLRITNYIFFNLYMKYLNVLYLPDWCSKLVILWLLVIDILIIFYHFLVVRLFMTNLPICITWIKATNIKCVLTRFTQINTQIVKY